MIDIPNHAMPPISKTTLDSLNNKLSQPLDKNTVKSLNRSRSGEAGRQSTERAEQSRVSSMPQQPRQNRAAPQQRQSNHSNPQQPQRNRAAPQQSPSPVQPSAQRAPDRTLPSLRHLLRRGQKTALNLQGSERSVIRVCFGWNLLDARCDMDASAFLLAGNGKVPGEEWFVFYGQTNSPDRSVSLSTDGSGLDRELFRVNLDRLNPAIQKIVFVLTINESFRYNLNFSMVRNAYVRVLDDRTAQEIVSYQLEEYSPDITSMTIAELYLHKGQWKINPVGNGLHQDLAGQCAIYGVEIV